MSFRGGRSPTKQSPHKIKDCFTLVRARNDIKHKYKTTSPLWGLTGGKNSPQLYNEIMSAKNEPLVSLQKVLALLIEQAHTYERALPHNNYAARAAVASLAKLAKQAQSEAVSLADSLQTQETSEHPFSPREHEVLALTADGLTNKEIAYRLGISERTVQFHMNSIFNKTTTNSRTEAVALALRNGWIDVIASGAKQSPR